MLKQEAVLLLGKLLFAQAKYTEALKEFDSINLDKLVLHSVTNRMLKILAEGLAVKGSLLLLFLSTKYSFLVSVRLEIEAQIRPPTIKKM